MPYYIDLFSPDTYETFSNSDRTISGFRERHRNIASDIKPGDKLVCYVTKLSRWVGILEVKSNYFEDSTPIFYPANDPFIIRFKVNANIWLPLEHSIPIFEDTCWNNLSFTKELPKGSIGWTGMVRGSLRMLDDGDGQYLEQLLNHQNVTPTIFPLSETDKKKLKSPTVKTQDNKQVSVTIPENEIITHTLDSSILTQRDSIKVQALIAEIGEKMDYKIWLPRSDRQRIFEYWKPRPNTVLEVLPLNYDDVTLKTIENIDVL